MRTATYRSILMALIVTTSACGANGDGSEGGDAAGTLSDGEGAATEVGDSSGDTSSGDEDGGPKLPNIDMQIVADRIASTLLVETITVEADSCALVEGCIEAPGLRRVLRFESATPNVGEGELYVGRPEDDPDAFEYAACHEHFHFKGFAEYRLLDGEGAVVREGHKQAFALIDYEAMSLDAVPAKFPTHTGEQGISPGWLDVYDAYLDCQWVDITELAPGDYQLEIEVNPERVFEESDYDDNLIRIPVTVGVDDDPPPPLPPEWSCDPALWNAGDGCHCGCGGFDPDCPNPTAEACDSCTDMGSCAEATSCADIDHANNARCH